MIKRKKLIRNIIILVIMISLIRSFFTLDFTPLAALKRSQKTANYGPSVVVKSEKINGGVLYLTKYDKWYSIDIIKQGALGLWYPGDRECGSDLDEGIDYTWMGNSDNQKHCTFVFAGKVNDKRIKSVVLELEVNGKIVDLQQKELKDDLFMFVCNESNAERYTLKEIKGYDKNYNIIFEKKLN